METGTSAMSEQRPILVPMDLHGASETDMETLVRVAQQLKRQLLCQVMEDIRLQQVADLPFTTEICLSGGRERSLLRDHLSQRHSLVTTDARQRLTELSLRHHVELKFRQDTGQSLHAVLESDDTLDIFLPAKLRWQQRNIAIATNRTVIQRLGLVLPAAENISAVLATAQSLLENSLVAELCIISDHQPDLRQLRYSGRRLYQQNTSLDAASLAQLLQCSPCQMLLISRNCLLAISPRKLDEALEHSGRQLLIVS